LNSPVLIVLPSRTRKSRTRATFTEITVASGMRIMVTPKNVPTGIRMNQMARDRCELLCLDLPKAEALRVGPGLDPATGMGPLIEPRALERVSRYVETARAYDAAFGKFLKRLAADGITAKNTLFVVGSEENDHLAGATVAWLPRVRRPSTAPAAPRFQPRSIRASPRRCAQPASSASTRISARPWRPPPTRI